MVVFWPLVSVPAAPTMQSSMPYGALHLPPRTAGLGPALISRTFTSFTVPPSAWTTVSTRMVSPAFAFLAAGMTVTRSLPEGSTGGSFGGLLEGSGDEVWAWDGGDDPYAIAEPEPATRSAAVPIPSKIGFVADRVTTAVAPPSHRR